MHLREPRNIRKRIDMSVEHVDLERARDIRVGLFVAGGIALLTLVLFLLGQERRFFEQPVYLKALFPNVAGLKVGAPVRLAGVDVGIVSAIEFPSVDPSSEIPLVDALSGENLWVDAQLPLSVKDAFETPMNVAVAAIDPRNELELRLRVFGQDQFGDAQVSEDLRLRVSEGRSTVTGARFFRKIDGVQVVSVRGVSADVQVGIGVGRLKKITVVMRISSEVLPRIRHDSEVRVDSMGLLGDKTIDISLGSQEYPPHEDGDVMRAANTLDVNAALADAQRILENVVIGTDELRKALAGFSSAGGQDALVAAVRSIQAIAEEIQSGQGLLHQIVFDKSAGTKYRNIVSDIATSTQTVDESLRELSAMLQRVKTGDGLVHELIYGKGGEQTVTEARNVLAEASQLLSDVRTKQGVVHNLIYDEDRGEFIGNLNEASDDVKQAAVDVKKMVADLRAIVEAVESGEGTVGALLQDPTVYEDLKQLLGNARRNEAVRALVRYGIADDDSPAPSKAPASQSDATKNNTSSP